MLKKKKKSLLESIFACVECDGRAGLSDRSWVCPPKDVCLPHMILHHEILCLGSFDDYIILPSPLPSFLKQKYKQEGEKDDKKHPALLLSYRNWAPGCHFLQGEIWDVSGILSSA